MLSYKIQKNMMVLFQLMQAQGGDSQFSSVKHGQTISNLVDSIEFTKKKPKKGQSETDSISSNHSYESKEKSKIWTQQQHQLFVILINKYGTDFNILSTFFPKKTKTQLKNRYKMKHNQDKKLAKQQTLKLQALALLFKEQNQIQQVQDN